MTINKNGWIQTIEYCPECDNEYVAHPCAPCRLCPLRARWHAATVDVRAAELYNLLSSDTDFHIETLINRAVADGWDLEHFDTATWGAQDTYFTAVMRRRDYDPDAHRAAVDAERKAERAWRAKAVQIQRAVAELKEARQEGSR